MPRHSLGSCTESGNCHRRHPAAPIFTICRKRGRICIQSRCAKDLTLELAARQGLDQVEKFGVMNHLAQTLQVNGIPKLVHKPHDLIDSSFLDHRCRRGAVQKFLRRKQPLAGFIRLIKIRQLVNDIFQLE